MLLAIDTATSTASLAVYDLGTRQLLAELTWQARRRQTQDLVPALQDLLRLVALAPPDITALAVTTGPGSFTGVRIAISAAKGMALGLPQPPRVVGIPTLSVTAAPYLATSGTGAAAICATIQAGRGRYNWAWYGAGDLLHRPTAAEHHAGTVTEYVTALAAHPGAVRLIGELGQDLVDALAAQELGHVVCVDPISGLRRAGSLPGLPRCTWRRGPATRLKPCSRST